VKFFPNRTVTDNRPGCRAEPGKGIFFMTCEFVQHDEVIIDYIEGLLQARVRKRFEEHYFICDECFQQLQMLEKVIALMRHHGEKIFVEKPASRFYRPARRG
jgi:anti-sigma factor RsiW